MRFRIKAAPVGALRILEQFPTSSLAVLEGLNGIGKSLAVRLLQLCTGVMPYRSNSAAWRSLCDGLGEFEVSVRGLRHDRTIEWVGDSRLWPHESPGDPTRDWFDAIRIDGKEASLDEVRRILGVYRIAGDEGLIETLAEDAEGYADVVRRWSRRTDGEGSLLVRLETVIGEAIDELGSLTPERHIHLRETSDIERAQLEEARNRLLVLSEKRDAMTEARHLSERFDSLQRKLPDMQREVRELDELISGLQLEKRQLDAQLSELVASKAVDQPKRHELENARTTLARNEGKLFKSAKSVAAAAYRLNVAATRADVEADLSEVDLELEELRSAQVEMDSAPAMRGLLDDVSGRLRLAEERGLPDQIAYDDPESHSKLTVERIRAGITNRRTQLEGQPPPPEMRDLAKQIIAASGRRDELQALLSALAEAERLRRLVGANQERVERALAAISDVSPRKSREIEAKRREVEDQLIDLAGKRATLLEELGGDDSSTVTTLRRRLDQLERELELSGRELLAASEVAETEVQEAQSIVGQRKALFDAAARDLAKAEAEVARAWASFTKERSFDWLRNALGPGDDANRSLEARVERLTGARLALERVLERLGSHRGQVAAVERALSGIARHLRGLDPQATEYVPELEDWLGRQFSEWFNNPILRGELFPLARGDVVVDVQSKEVSWTEGDDAARTRPLEAFSSGEQAFAYTRARLAMLDEEQPPENRFIALDEFGAFIAHDRLTELLKYLKARAEDHPSDQVLVILPLSRDYALQSKSVFGEEQQELQGMAEQIEERSYAVRELV